MRWESRKRPRKSKTLACETERFVNAKRLGVRWQGGSRDTAFGLADGFWIQEVLRAGESGVALRFPPQSKTRWRAE